MGKIDSISGQDLRDMFSTATSWLEKSAADIDALNVFPVPDGDTGTNMLLTMRSSIEEAYRAPDSSASAVVQGIAHGALMGARGNSGVILSQIWRGLAQGLKNNESITAADLANALQQAATTAYNGINNPVEGTILTVIKDVAAVARAQVKRGDNDLVSMMEAVVEAASESVANTPNLLPVLRKAGVVDAGGQGLYVLLDGILRHLRGEAEQMQFRKPQIIPSNLPQPVHANRSATVLEVPYGYCTEFMLKGEKLAADAIRTKLKKKGESLIVVGDESVVRVHIHTIDPGSIIRYGTSLGTLHQVSMRNMDEQYQDFIEMQKERGPAVEIATVAVVAGDGLADVFTSLGVGAIVPGGQTMNPSTKEILQAVNSLASDKVIILPNNKNIVMTAQQVLSLTTRGIEIVPTESVPQGIAALLAFDYEADFETNVQRMSEAKSRVKTIEITRAVRPARMGKLSIKKKQVIGLLDGELLTAGNDPLDVLDKTLSKLCMDATQVVTIYYGADSSAGEAEQISERIRKQYPGLQIEVVRGGQPHYNYIVSIE
ncbi:MAG: DAK2 domain-containing protein [Chloroflexi bacterium]|nr:DAK2 domain-containing protein [Chloroflexota bacterium]